MREITKKEVVKAQWVQVSKRGNGRLIINENENIEAHESPNFGKDIKNNSIANNQVHMGAKIMAFPKKEAHGKENLRGVKAQARL